ncbi:MAG: Xaa-Pro peptidase family protein [Holophaga sp.]|jgi:Xaa-Pro dipeptidase
MTLGVGGKNPEMVLAGLPDLRAGAAPIGLPEYQARVARAQARMREAGLAAVYVHAGSNLKYFTGTQWKPSERLVGALIPAAGEPEYLAPFFERGTLLDFRVLPGQVHVWNEHESPHRLLLDRLAALGCGPDAKVGLCDGTPFSVFDGLRRLAPERAFVSAQEVTEACRMRKTEQEIALIQRAHRMTLVVQAAAASIVAEGMSTLEVEAFVNEAHKRVGSDGTAFCIVLFGSATQFPHGVREPQRLKSGDLVLVDTGCLLHDYPADITRTYVFGAPTERQRAIWDLERGAQLAAFAAAQLGTETGAVDQAVRRFLEANGLGPGYALPGLPHRTGHGMGLDVHEAPYLVQGSRIRLEVGMCFSDEPMICVPGEFGVRLEDHIHMTGQGPDWFTRPSPSIDDPFGLVS